MARQYGVQLVRLQDVLALLADLEPIAYGELVTELTEEFGCSKRTAQDHPQGPTLLRIARKLFTTVPSANVRRFRAGLITRDGSAEAALLRFEREMLTAPHKTQTLAQQLERLIDRSGPLGRQVILKTLVDLGVPGFSGKLPRQSRRPPA